MKSILILIFILLNIGHGLAQAKKPQIMVFPSDNWMEDNGYVYTISNQGKTSYQLDYRKALLKDQEMKMCISAISDVLVGRNFPPKILDEELKRLESSQAEDAVVTSKDGEDISTSQLYNVLLQARSDIMIKLFYQIKGNRAERYVTFALEGIDAYTSESIGSVSGNTEPSGGEDISTILATAVAAQIDPFVARLQKHFDDLLANGRKISLNVSTFNGWEYDLESEDFGDDELNYLIDDWVADNTQANRYNLNFSDDRKMTFESVRIPLYYTDSRGSQKAQDAKRWANGLRKYLKELGISSKVITKGLGSVQIILGAK